MKRGMRRGDCEKRDAERTVKRGMRVGDCEKRDAGRGL